VKQEVAFLKKSDAKKLLLWAAGRFQHRAKRSESFLVLFFKKELLPSLPSLLPVALANTP